MSELAILIPVFNKLNLTIKCIESLLPLIGPGQQKNFSAYIVVIDDGSTDGTGDWISQNYPEVVLLKGDGNLWWSGGINMGARYVLENRQSDYLLLWNNDIIPEQVYFARLDELILELGEDMIIGSKIYTLDPPDQIWAFGAVFNPRNGKKYMIGFEQADREEFETAREVDWLPGMGTLVPVSAIERIGYWDAENFPQYHGDSDYTYRAKTMGYRIMVYPQLKLWNDSMNTGLNHGGKLSNLILLLKDKRSLYHFRKNMLFLRRFSKSYLAYWPLVVSYSRLFGGFFKWKLLGFFNTRKFWKINILYLKISNRIYLFYLKFKKRIIKPTPAQKILFSSSKPDWSGEIQRGFKNSRHTIFFDEISSKISRDFDLIVPLTIQELESREIQALLKDNPLPIPSVESIQLCDDKYQFNQALSSNGFAKYIPRMNDGFAFPYILKKKVDQYGENTHIISRSQDEVKYSEKIKSPEYFTQEIIAGKTEFATHIVFKDGKIVNSLNIKYIFRSAISIKGKDESLTVICPCPYLKIFASILGFIGYEGLCCFNYKVRDDTPYIIEINPRFGGSLTPYFSLFV